MAPLLNPFAGMRRRKTDLPKRAELRQTPGDLLRVGVLSSEPRTGTDMAPSNAPIPFLDLVTPHVELEEELLSVFRGALRTGGFVGGSAVDDFERTFAEFCGVRHAVGVASGTDALLFALLAADVKPGDTVVTVPNTFIATTEAIRQAGAPDFVDVDERTSPWIPCSCSGTWTQNAHAAQMTTGSRKSTSMTSTDITDGSTPSRPVS
jgi:hypothetical protein